MVTTKTTVTITNGARSTPKIHPCSVFLFRLEWGCSKQLDHCSIAYGLALGVFIRPCTHGGLLPRRVPGVAPSNKPQPQTALYQCAP